MQFQVRTAFMHACIVQSPQVIFGFIYAAISSASGCIVLAGVSSSEAARIQTRRQCEGMHLLDTVFPSTICLSSRHCSRFGECIVRQVVPASLRGLLFVANAFPRRLRCHHLEMSSSLAVLSTKIPLRYELSTACVMIAFTSPDSLLNFTTPHGLLFRRFCGMLADHSWWLTGVQSRRQISTYSSCRNESRCPASMWQRYALARAPFVES